MLRRGFPLVSAPDDNQRRTTRRHRQFGNTAQEAFYQGRLHSHGLSKHDLAFFDGTHMTFIGSAADNDLGLLKRPRQVEAFEFLVLPDGTPVCMIGDQAYYGYPSPCVAAKPRGHIPNDGWICRLTEVNANTTALHEANMATRAPPFIGCCSRECG